jgi:hypothetical protein
MSDLPAPLTQADCDLRNFAYMGLDVVRLRDSEMAAMADAEAFRANVIAWCVSWHQTPAASLPDDDVLLCRLLGYGRDVKGWLRTREAGFVKCSDGRLYHPVVAEKATEAWNAKRAQRDRTEAARLARQSQKTPPNNVASVTEKIASVTDDVTTYVTESIGEERIGEDKEVPTSSGEAAGQAGDGQGDLIPDIQPEPPPGDARTALFRDGLAVLRRLTGKPEGPSRALLGSLLRDAKDDAAGVLALIRNAEDIRPADPIPWLKAAALKRGSGPGLALSAVPSADDPLGLYAWIARQPTKLTKMQDGTDAPCLNGWDVDYMANRVIDAVNAGGGRWAGRVNWDALAGWCRDDVFDASGGRGWKGIVSRVAGSLAGPIHSMAVFDAALRDAARRAA